MSLNIDVEFLDDTLSGMIPDRIPDTAVPLDQSQSTNIRPSGHLRLNRNVSLSCQHSRHHRKARPRNSVSCVMNLSPSSPTASSSLMPPKAAARRHSAFDLRQTKPPYNLNAPQTSSCSKRESEVSPLNRFPGIFDAERVQRLLSFQTSLIHTSGNEWLFTFWKQHEDYSTPNTSSGMARLEMEWHRLQQAVREFVLRNARPSSRGTG